MFKNINSPTRRRAEDGLTMIELLTTIAVLGVVTAIASPIIISMIQRAQIDAYQAEMSYVADSTGKMINGTFGQPWRAASKPQHEGENVNISSLGARLDPQTGNLLVGSTYGYWFDIGEIKVPFNTDNPDAQIIWQNSRIIRVVPTLADGSALLSGTPGNDIVIADACLTAWIGNLNVVIPSIKNPANVLIAEDEGIAAPCGLIPGPLEPPSGPGAPTALEPAGSDATSKLIVSGMTDPERLGGEDPNIAIEMWRVSCIDESGGTALSGENQTKTVEVSGLTRGLSYTCTAQVKTNAYPAWGPSSGESISVKIPEAPNLPTALSAEPSNGQLIMTWTAPTYNGCNDDSTTFSCGANFLGIQDYEVQYILGVDDTDPTTLTDADFASASSVTTTNANVNYTLGSLVNGSTYYVRIRAITENSSTGAYSISLPGAWSDPIVKKTATPPDAIADPIGEDGTNQVVVKFNVPYNGGLPIQRYEIWYDIENTFDTGGTDRTGPSGVLQPLGRAIVVCDDVANANYNATVCGKTQGEQITITIDTLPDSTSYFVRLFTSNAMGLSDWSKTATQDPYNLPVATFAPAEAPASADATIDDSGNATVTWE